MWPVFDVVAQNLGVSLEVGIMIVFLLGNIIFYAVDVKKGLVVGFVGSSTIFVWFYLQGLNYNFPVVIFFMHLILLSFTLLASGKAQTRGGFV